MGAAEGPHDMVPADNTRRSDRIELELRISVSGTDALGKDFVEESYTTIVGRHGAKIVLRRRLAPDQEIVIRCEGSGREAPVRVIGQAGEDEEGTYYTVKFLDPGADVWGIEFPSIAESERAVERVFLECGGCGCRELTYLDEFETEVFEANRQVSHPCKQCRDRTMWRQSPGSPPVEPVAPPPPPVETRTQNERKHPRMGLNVKACIRSSQFDEEIVTTLNISRGGFAFQSSRAYTAGMAIQAAVPYAPGGANIFTAARVARIKDLPEEKKKIIGVAYLPAHEGRQDR